MSTLKDLQRMGGFVSAIPVKKEIKFKVDGDEEYAATIHVRKLSAGDYETLFVSDSEGRSRTASVISQCVTLGADGKEKVSFEDAYRLHPNLATAMVNAFNEVNASKKS